MRKRTKCISPARKKNIYISRCFRKLFFVLFGFLNRVKEHHHMRFPAPTTVGKICQFLSHVNSHWSRSSWIQSIKKDSHCSLFGDNHHVPKTRNFWHCGAELPSGLATEPLKALKNYWAQPWNVQHCSSESQPWWSSRPQSASSNGDCMTSLPTATSSSRNTDSCPPEDIQFTRSCTMTNILNKELFPCV